MFKRVSSICLIFAWLCASGALLDTVQVFAWARMFVGYARTMSVADAAVQTFDPGKPCAICLAVQRVRETEPRQQSLAAPAAAAKTPMTPVENEVFILLAARPEWSEAAPALMASWRARVPVPPPRTQTQVLVG